MTVDLDAPDAHLADWSDQKRSKWPRKDRALAKLPAGETFYDKDRAPTRTIQNKHSLFAQTVKRHRMAATP